MVDENASRTYDVKNCIAFRKTNEIFGGLSNMAPGFPITLSGVQFLTSEALYQVCRFPKYPDIQYDIIAQRSPMHAKSISRHYDHLSRKDWEDVRLPVMKWALRAKLICNWEKFGDILKATGDKVIVEDSDWDLFWGHQKTKGSTVV